MVDKLMFEECNVCFFFFCLVIFVAGDDEFPFSILLIEQNQLFRTTDEINEPKRTYSFE